jgi:hypothetical protein
MRAGFVGVGISMTSRSTFEEFEGANPTERFTRAGETNRVLGGLSSGGERYVGASLPTDFALGRVAERLLFLTTNAAPSDKAANSKMIQIGATNIVLLNRQICGGLESPYDSPSQQTVPSYLRAYIWDRRRVCRGPHEPPRDSGPLDAPDRLSFSEPAHRGAPVPTNSPAPRRG